MALDVLEQKFKLPVDFGDVDEAIRRVDRLGTSTADTTSRAEAMSAATRYAGEVAATVAREILGLSDAELIHARSAAGVAQAMDEQVAAAEQYDAHIKSYVSDNERWAAVTVEMDSAVARFSKKLENASLGAGRAGKGVRSMLTDVKFLSAATADAARTGLAKFEDGLESLKNKAKDFTGESLKIAFGFGIAQSVGSALHSIVDLPAKILESAAAAERLDNAFQFTLGSQAEPVLGWIERIASKTQFTEDQLKGMALQMTRVGIPVQDLDKDMAAALDIAARSADPLGAMGSAIDAFAEGARRGVVNMRLLRPLGLGPEALKVLPEFAKMNDKQLRKQIDAGNLTTDQLRAVIAGADGMLGDIGLKGGNDMESKIKNLKQLPDLLYQEFAKNPAFDVLKGKMDELYQFFSPDGPGGAAVLGFINKTGSAAVDWIKGLDFDELAVDLRVAGDVFSGIGWVIQHLIYEPLKATLELLHDFTPLGFIADQVSAFSGETKKINADNKALIASFDAIPFKKTSDVDDNGEPSFLRKSPRSPVVREAARVPIAPTGNITIHAPVTVHAQNAGSPEEVGHEVSKKLGQTIPGHIHGALDQLGRQGGY